MAQWTMTDNANGAPSWANTTLNVPKNKDELYANVTIGAARANIAYGTFGVSTSEMAFANTSEARKVTHAGWTLRTEGQGGRAGRVFYETLVAASSISGDGSNKDDSKLPE
jgi:hypothetical protein